MGVSASTGVPSRSQEAIEHWWRTSPSLDQLFFDDANEIWSTDFVVHDNPESSLELSLNQGLSEGKAAINTGVRPDRMSSVVEQILIELEALCVTQAPQDESRRQRILVLNGIHRCIQTQALDRMETGTGNESIKSGEDGNSTQWPSRYVTTQQVRSLALCDMHGLLCWLVLG